LIQRHAQSLTATQLGHGPSMNFRALYLDRNRNAGIWSP
jgi:hypothetical protein